MTSPQPELLVASAATTLTLEEYIEAQEQLTEAMIGAAVRILSSLPLPLNSRGAWRSVLMLLYPIVEHYRRESAELGRDFYDSQRIKHIGEEFPIFRSEYQPDWFEEAMEPARERLSRSNADEDSIAYAALRVAKVVEDGGRRTVVRGIEADPMSQRWARIATGRETCAFCLMLVSRGPVYLSAESAGARFDDVSAERIIERGNIREQDELMNRWHPGCDCKVVPVYDTLDWPGRDAYLKASDTWARLTKGWSGKNALNALRRELERGSVSPADFAVAV